MTTSSGRTNCTANWDSDSDWMALFSQKDSRAVISFLTHIQRLNWNTLTVNQKHFREGLKFSNSVSAALTVSYGGVLRVQDARFLQRSDAGVDQLQACCQLLLDVLLAFYMHTGHRRVTHESVERKPLRPVVVKVGAVALWRGRQGVLGRPLKLGEK